MNDLLYEVMQNVRLEEGKVVLEQLLLSIYFKEGISTKELSREVLLPVPLIAAIKNEFKKKGWVVQDRGIRLTDQGKGFIEKDLQYQGLDRALYQTLTQENFSFETVFKNEFAVLHRIFDARPQVDVTIDQSKCTAETSMKRAVLCLQNKSLIGKRILCVGDDDLVSVAVSLLAKKLFPNQPTHHCSVTVLDMDERFLETIKQAAKTENLPITCHKTDLRETLPEALTHQFDCFFTDPPYTLPGMELFISRGITALKEESGLPIYFSFANKTPEFTLNMQWAFLDMGLVTTQILTRFNQYEGAEIIGNTGQMIVLRTTKKTEAMIQGDYQEAIYTGEMRKTVRVYRCKACKHPIDVGFNQEVKTIEQLKEQGCPKCHENAFDLLEKTEI